MSQKRRILILEDDPFISRMYQTKLTEEGFDARVLADGKTGLDFSEEFNPELVLLDISMPELNGLEFLEQFKAEGSKFKSVPVIVLTNSADVDDIAKAKNLGAADYLIKSNTIPSDVLDIIEKHLSK